MGEGDQTLGLQFPCRFPVKVMGTATASFESTVVAIVERHAGRIDRDRVARRPSRTGRYVSLTIDITAHSREQLDALYRELSGSPAVSVVL